MFRRLWTNTCLTSPDPPLHGYPCNCPADPDHDCRKLHCHRSPEHNTKDATWTAVSHLSMCNFQGCVTNKKAWHALSAQLKQANLLCLSVHTWQCGVGQPSPKKQCSMQKVGYIWKACMNFANRMGRMLISGGLHQPPVSVELLGSAVAAAVCRHAGYNAPAAAHLSINHHGWL